LKGDIIKKFWLSQKKIHHLLLTIYIEHNNLPLCPSTKWWPFQKGSFQSYRNIVHKIKCTYPNNKWNNFSTYFLWMPLLKNNAHLPQTWKLEYMLSLQALWIPRACAWRWHNYIWPTIEW
jgi:hypothetical protein